MYLVTGGAGFIGSNLVAHLAARGEAVAVCDWLGRDERWRNLAHHELAALVAPEALMQWLASPPAPLQAVLHLGAISTTTETDVDRLAQWNVRSTLELLQWCTEHQVRFLYASSAATYGDGTQGFDDAGGLTALRRLRPMNLYGWSKQAFDQWALRRAAEGQAPPFWAGLKFFNVFGPNEYHKAEMMSLVAKNYARIAAGETIRLFRSHRAGIADGEQQRDFVYVKDCVAVMLWLWRQAPESGIYNLGTGAARSFLDLMRATGAACGRPPVIEYVDTPPAIRPNYQYLTEARMDRLRGAGYNAPFTPLETAVADFVKGYLATPDPYL